MGLRQEWINKAIEHGYDIEPSTGIIRSPGKFEGEMFYALYFYDAMLNGDGEDFDGVSVFELSDDERREFHELENIPYLTMKESDNGFIFLGYLTKAQYEHLGAMGYDCFDQTEE